jgi:drug/metabolite transporter (DMT)-like permease
MHMQAIKKRMGPIEWSLLIVLAIIWGGSFFFIGIAVKALPPFTIVALRVTTAAIVLSLFMLAMGMRMPREPRLWTALFGMGLLNNLVPFSLIVWGQTHIASGLASILNAATPLFAVLIAHFLTDDEKITPGRLAGVSTGLAGVVLMIGPDALKGLGTSAIAQVAVLGAAISYAYAGVFGRRFRVLGLAPLATATGQVTASAVMLMPLAILVDQPWTLPMPDWSVWAAVIALAVICTALAYFLYFRLLATAGATNLMLVTFLIPVSAIVLGTTILGERLELKHFFGMGLIGLGLAAIDGRPFSFFRRGRRPTLARAALAHQSSQQVER